MAGSLVGKRVLLVEDDELVASTVEDIMFYSDVQRIRTVACVSEALAALDGEAFDLAIVDVNLNGEASWPVAAELRNRDIPYLTVTGYGDLCDHELVGSLLCKPYSMDGLIGAVTGLVDDSITEGGNQNPGGEA